MHQAGARFGSNLLLRLVELLAVPALVALLWFVAGAAEPRVDDGIALLTATAHGDMRTLRAQLRRLGSIDAPDAFGTTPLLAAVRSGNHEAVRYLLANGANVNQCQPAYG